MEENKQIELRSEKVRNIIGQIPPILITHGTMFIGLALLSLFLAAAFIPYQPTIDTDITVLQMPNDKLYFTAKIPQKEMNKQLQFVGISANSSTDLPIPIQYTIVTISDTIYLTDNDSYYIATLYPINDVLKAFKIKETITLPAKIELQKKAVLKWMIEKMWR